MRRAQGFYERKAKARIASQGSCRVASLAFDFHKNLGCPNITTNEVYYSRQLSCFTFNVHNLGTEGVHLYFYDETEARKGADEFCAMLYDYFVNVLPPEVEKVELFCDSCPGQNKNWSMIKFLHHMVVKEKRFSNIKISFPVRGHSYLECDRDMALVNQKAKVEVPDDWKLVYTSARRNPSPYHVVTMTGTAFLNIASHIKSHYKTACPVQTRPLKEVTFSKAHPQLIQYRDSWNGPFLSSHIIKQTGQKQRAVQTGLASLYRERLPIKKAKFDDLQKLKRFCSPSSMHFFDNLPHVNSPDDDGDRNASDCSDIEE